MVWIHGGGFTTGSGNFETDFYGPGYILDRDVVLVTINYRLGPFGNSINSNNKSNNSPTIFF
jgi:carboxylesterase type B